MVGSVRRIGANTKVVQQMPCLPVTLHNDGQRVLSPLGKMHSATQCSCTNTHCHSLWAAYFAMEIMSNDKTDFCISA